MENKKQAAFPVCAVLWLDMELRLTDAEYKELRDIKELIDHYNSMILPHSVLPRKKIDLKKSELIKKLISAGYCSLAHTEIEIRKRIIDKEELTNYRKDVEDTYLKILTAGGISMPPFPSAVFSTVDVECLDIDCDDFGSYNTKRLSQEEGLIRINFSSQNLPDIICLGTVVPKLKDICMKKITEHLALLAGKNPQYYSDKIMLYKRYFRGHNLELIEMETGKLQTVNEKQTREGITRIVLNRVNEVNDALDMFLTDTASGENSYILTNFSIDSRRDFEFYQALYLLLRGIMNQRQHHSVNNSTLIQAIRQSISGFVTVKELKQHALKMHPELTEEEYNSIYANFDEHYVGLNAKMPSPLVMKQYIPKGNTSDQYLVHVSNLNSFLETRLIKASDDIQDIIRTDWKEKLKKHTFDEGMFKDSVFRKQLIFYLEKNFFTLFCFMRNDRIGAFLDMAGLLSPRVKAVRQYGLDKLDQSLRLNREELYETITLSLLSPLSRLSRFIFKFLHWLTKSLYLRKPEKERIMESLPNEKIEPHGQEPVEREVQPPSHKLLKFCHCSSEDELSGKLQQLWSRIPDQNLQRDDIEQNILRDLNSFFTDKEIIYFESLEFMIDTNLNRILSRGQHLVPYSDTIREFIVHQICYTIYVDSYMRKKIRFKKIL